MAMPAAHIAYKTIVETATDASSILKYHIVPGEIASFDGAKLGSVLPLKGMESCFLARDGAVPVGGARFVQTDIVCSNGIIHAIDTVLVA